VGLMREELTDDPHNHKTVYVRIKVLAEPGRRYANVEIPYSRRHFTIYDLSGRTIHSDGTIVPFTGKPFDRVMVRRKERGKEETLSSQVLHPAGRAGGEHSGVTAFTRATMTTCSFAPEWEVQTDLFQKKATFQVSSLFRIAPACP